MSGLEAAALTALGKVGSAMYTAAQHEVTYEAAVKLVTKLESFGSKELLHPDYVAALESMDIKASLSTIQALIDDLRQLINDNNSHNNESKSIQVCMSNLHETVNKIENNLELIENKCKDWKESWWSYVYSYPDCTTEISNLTKLKKIMDNRIELLTRAVTLELQMKVLSKSDKNNDKSEDTEMKQP